MLHDAREIVWNGAIRLSGAPSVENHQGEHLDPVREQVSQDCLIHAIDLAKQPADSIAYHARACGTACSEAHLKWNIGADFFNRRDSEYDPNGTGSEGEDIVARPVEERPNQAAPFQSVVSGKRVATVALFRRRVLQGDSFTCRSSLRSPRGSCVLSCVGAR